MKMAPHENQYLRPATNETAATRMHECVQQVLHFMQDQAALVNLACPNQIYISRSSFVIARKNHRIGSSKKICPGHVLASFQLIVPAKVLTHRNPRVNRATNSSRVF